MRNIEQTFISQYANSPRLIELISRFNEAVDPRKDLDLFYTTVWDFYSATGYGLDVWGRIVDVPRSIRVPVTLPDVFGFSDGTQPFGQAPFYVPGSVFGTYQLSDTQYRQLLMAKMVTNISGCSIPVTNQILNSLFETAEGRCYATDLLNMRMLYVCEFFPTAVEQAIILSSGVMPKPSGVQTFLMQLDPPTSFGFSGSGLQPFGQGVFVHSPISEPPVFTV